jgi:hypothetical protein
MPISLLPENTENYVEINNKKCKFCEEKNKFINTFYNNEIFNCCPLCNVTVNFNKSYTFYCVLCYSELSQIDIIKKTKKIYKETGLIPFPKELDNNVKYINIPVYLYAKFENKNSNFKLFFTNKVIDIINDETDDVFDIPKTKEKRILCDYINIDRYLFDEQQKIMYDTEIMEIKKKNYNLLYRAKTKFTNKIAKKA